MDIEQELNIMMERMASQTGRGPDRIVCNRETLEQLVSMTNMRFVSTDTLDDARGYVSRYNGTPIIVSPAAEPGRLYLMQNAEGDYVMLGDAPQENGNTTYTVGQWWTRDPFGPVRPSYYAMLDYDVSQLAKPQEEPGDIDDDSFLDIL